MALFKVLISLTVIPALVSHSQGLCPSLGLECSATCSTIAFCYEIGQSSIGIVSCTDKYGKLCGRNPDSGDLECNSLTCGDPLAPHLIWCMVPGNIPSPYRCDESFICTEHFRQPALTCRCDAGEYYDVVTGGCLKEPGCPLIPVDCSKIGHVGDLGNGFCYTCNERFQPYVFQCPYANTTNLEPENKFNPNGIKGMTCSEYVPPLNEEVDQKMLNLLSTGGTN